MLSDTSTNLTIVEYVVVRIVAAELPKDLMNSSMMGLFLSQATESGESSLYVTLLYLSFLAAINWMWLGALSCV